MRTILILATAAGCLALCCAPAPVYLGTPASGTEQPSSPSDRPGEGQALTFSGLASYYGKEFHGRRTASGETFDMHALTAAHRTLPFGTVVKVTNDANGKSVQVRINDRGPFVADRIIDLSYAAAKAIGLLSVGPVRIEVVKYPAMDDK
ncbi:MAG TPA: septal ring lytic transglycosylase RlpA family protein [Candidatus Edwardsbacteria bacterium]|nr:septal ring lytic transglycosylase RlpA family protein [Candidatus Edwardsbacteria bacterium]